MRLLERQSITGRVDHAAGIIRGVRVLGASSRNGRRYLPEAMRRALSLYEGARVNIDHPRPGSEASVTSTVGVLRDAKLTRGGIIADLHILQKHPAAGLILERAEKAPHTFGLSHNAEGEVEREGGEIVVTRITEVKSVDLVSDPATTRTLFESRRTMRQRFREMDGDELDDDTTLTPENADDLEAVRMLLTKPEATDADRIQSAIDYINEIIGTPEPTMSESFRGHYARATRGLSLAEQLKRGY